MELFSSLCICNVNNSFPVLCVQCSVQQARGSLHSSRIFFPMYQTRVEVSGGCVADSVWPIPSGGPPDILEYNGIHGALPLTTSFLSFIISSCVLFICSLYFASLTTSFLFHWMFIKQTLCSTPSSSRKRTKLFSMITDKLASLKKKTNPPKEKKLVIKDVFLIPYRVAIPSTE